MTYHFLDSMKMTMLPVNPLNAMRDGRYERILTCTSCTLRVSWWWTWMCSQAWGSDSRGLGCFRNGTDSFNVLPLCCSSLGPSWSAIKIKSYPPYGGYCQTAWVSAPTESPTQISVPGPLMADHKFSTPCVELRKFDPPLWHAPYSRIV